MIEENNILISELKLSDLQNLAETLLKIVKVFEGERKKLVEDTLAEVVGFINKALKKEIKTTAEYYRMISDITGGEDKFLEAVLRRNEELSKRPKRNKDDNNER